MPKSILITGGAGFIGSHLVEYILTTSYHDTRVIMVDKLDYPANLEIIEKNFADSRFKFYQFDVQEVDSLLKLLREYEVDTVYHLAANSHVDISINSPQHTVQNNIQAGLGVVEAVRLYLKEIKDEFKRSRFKLVNLSTDEVFGDYLHESVAANEKSVYNPSSPYSASKGAVDQIMNAYSLTYNIPLLTLHLCNVFGAAQHPVKLIPRTIMSMLSGNTIGVYGTGKQIRSWIYVKDAVRLIVDLAIKWGGSKREKYVVNGESLTNLEVIHHIAHYLEQYYPLKDNEYIPTNHLDSYEELIEHVADRAAHDNKYWLDDSLLQTTGIKLPNHDFISNIQQTILWYVQNHKEQLARLIPTIKDKTERTAQREMSLALVKGRRKQKQSFNPKR